MSSSGYNFNDYLAGAQYNCHQWSSQGVNAEQVKLQRSISNALAEQDRIQKEHDAEHKPEQFITEKVRHMIEFAVRAGYGNNLARFAADVQTLKEHANLQDDGK